MSEGRERYYRQIREIRDELGVSHDEARRRWSDYYAPGGIPRRPVRQLTLSIKASTTDTRVCPFCRDSIFHPDDDGGPDYTCQTCGAHYHLDCFEEELNGQCATLGCTTRRVVARVRTRIRAGRNETDRATNEGPDLDYYEGQTWEDPIRDSREPYFQSPTIAAIILGSFAVCIIGAFIILWNHLM